MKAQDFRIGNLILDTNHPEREARVLRLNGGIEYPITYSYNKAFEHTPKNGEGLEGIPLSDDWQQRLGVRQLGMNKFEHLDTGFDLSSACEIKWVHQIQNIFFCASGNELTIKEKQAA